MNKIVSLFSKSVAAFAFLATIVSVNSACTFLAHQPEVPDEAMKLKKW